MNYLLHLLLLYFSNFFIIIVLLALSLYLLIDLRSTGIEAVWNGLFYDELLLPAEGPKSAQTQVHEVRTIQRAL